MLLKTLLPSLLLLFVAKIGVTSEKTMPVAEIAVGMRGTCKTVFTGTEIEAFEFEVLDILPNFRAKRDLILVKLVGEKVQHTGVVAGMSGSPAYIDGKLIGALAYRFGIFSKEPIAGITPIAQMLEILDSEEVREEELAANNGWKPEFLEIAIGVREFQWESLTPPQFQQLRRSPNASGVTPLETPLLFSGFESAVVGRAAQVFDGLGFEVQSTGGALSQEEGNNHGELQAGSAFSAVLVDGDFGLQATGTVTYRDGDRILGMGHPFLNNGAVSLPLGHAKILTTLSSLMASTKMSALTRVVGTIHQDRTTGLLGLSGEAPSTIPFRLTFEKKFQEGMEFNFRVAEDRSLHSLTPLIVGLVLNNAIESARLANSNQTLQLNGMIHLKNRAPIALENYYAGGSPSAPLTDAMEAIGEISSVIGALLSNNFESPDIESVELNFKAHHKKYLANVQRIEVDKSVVKPGEQLNVSVYLREYQGREQRITHTLVVPEAVSARRISIFAGSGERLTRSEFRTSPQKFQPKSFEQLVRMLEKRRKNNYLFFQIRQSDRGALIEGEEHPGLPPSIRAVMNAQRASGNVVTLRDRRLVEDHVPTEYSVSGGRAIWVNVRQEGK